MQMAEACSYYQDNFTVGAYIRSNRRTVVCVDTLATRRFLETDYTYEGCNRYNTMKFGWSSPFNRWDIPDTLMAHSAFHSNTVVKLD